MEWNLNRVPWFFAYFFLGGGCTLPETNSEFTPENGWLEYFLVSFWVPAYFQGRLLLVSGRVNGFYDRFE